MMFSDAAGGFLPGAKGGDPHPPGALWAVLGGSGTPLGGGFPAGIDGSFWWAGYAVADPGVSQYDALRAHLSGGAGLPGHVFGLAAAGSGCHGQDGRAWRALPGNLHLTVGLRADLPAADFGPVLPALPAVAALDAVRDLAPGAALTGIKWVNDILAAAAGRPPAKCAGVLTAVRSVGGRIEAVVLGLGLNVAAAPDLDGDPAVPAACCLDDFRARPAGLEPALAAVLAAVAARWTALAERGPAALAATYREASLAVGCPVEVWSDGRAGVPVLTASGTVLDIGDDLSLQLDDGGPPVTAGRLRLGDR